MTQPEDYTDATRTIGGKTFRPLSAGSFALLYRIGSPFAEEGKTPNETDIIIYGWMHAAPVAEVVHAVISGKHQERALEWAHTAPPCVFEVLTSEVIRAALEEVEELWIDEKTGFVPFLRPAPIRKPSGVQAVTTGELPSLNTLPEHATIVLSAVERPSLFGCIALKWKQWRKNHKKS